jgi:hypothetical protein
MMSRSLTKPENREVYRTIADAGLVFWVVMPNGLADIYDLGPRNGGSTFPQNTSTYLKVHIALQPGRATKTSSPP